MAGKRDIELARLEDDMVTEEEIIIRSITKLREIKKNNPSLKRGYKVCIGGVLNAYREGDLDFDESIAVIEKINNKV